jgi:hypothetical protein
VGRGLLLATVCGGPSADACDGAAFARVHCMATGALLSTLRDPRAGGGGVDGGFAPPALLYLKEAQCCVTGGSSSADCCLRVWDLGQELFPFVEKALRREDRRVDRRQLQLQLQRREGGSRDTPRGAKGAGLEAGVRRGDSAESGRDEGKGDEGEGEGEGEDDLPRLCRRVYAALRAAAGDMGPRLQVRGSLTAL